MAQAALINFFGDSGSQSQTSTQQSNQSTIDSEVTVSNNQQGTSLPISTYQTSYNNSPYTIPTYHIQEEHPQTLILQRNKTTTDKVTEYHNITPILILILIEEE